MISLARISEFGKLFASSENNRIFPSSFGLHLLFVRSESEDVLHVSAHVQRFQHLVTLVKDEMFDVLELERLLSRQRQDATRGADDDVRAILFQRVLVLFDVNPAEEDGCLDVGHVLGESVVFFGDLEGQFASMAQDDHADLTVYVLELLQRGQNKPGRFAHS